MRKMTAVCILCSVLLFAAGTQAQEKILGDWEGNIMIGETYKLGMIVHFKSVDGKLTATIDIPQQNAKGLPLKEVSFKNPKVHFELPAGPGLAVYDGKLEKGEIKGEFTQASYVGTFELKRPEKKEEKKEDTEKKKKN